jgi:hypothetical protein
MATTGGTVPTLVDIVSRSDPDGTFANIAEVLNQSTVVVQDCPWMEANGRTFHRSTLRTSLPDTYFRRYNEGVLPSKSTTGQVDEMLAMLESWSEIDNDLLKLNNNSATWRMSEERPFKVSMGIKAAQTLIYGNHSTDPKSFTGLSTRYNDVNLGESGSGLKDGAVVDGGGTGGDNTSIWLIGWGSDTVHGVYPQGSVGGLQVKDAGLDVKTDANGGLYWVARTHFKWDMGLAVRDWRAVVRIANLDTSLLIANSGMADLTFLMIRALGRRPPDLIPMARWAFYVNPVVGTMLEVQALAKASSQLTLGNYQGQPITTFRGVPINVVEQILGNEAQLT